VTLGVANVSPHHELLAGPGGTLAGVAVTKDPSCRGSLAGSLGIGAVRSGGAGRPEVSAANQAHATSGACGTGQKGGR
jgi:hypothetical protein